MTAKKHFEHVTLYILEDYDGGSGFSNAPNGFIVKEEKLADEFKQKNPGSSYKIAKGVIIKSLDDMADAQIEKKKMAALDKLTEEEKNLLGLNTPKVTYR